MKENAVNKNNTENFLNAKDIALIRRRKTWFINKLTVAEEIQYANERLRYYIAAYSKIKMEQFELIKDIIYEEVIKHRFHNWVNKETDVVAIEQLMKSIHSMNDKIGSFLKNLDSQVKEVSKHD